MDMCLKAKREPRWNGKRCKPEKKYGYIKIYLPDHPRNHSGYVYEHTLIAERALGKYLPDGAVVHHHTPKQLVICQDQGYHRLMHTRKEAYEVCGHADWRKCCYCQKWDEPDKLFFAKKRQYHRSCKNIKQKERRLEIQWGKMHLANSESFGNPVVTWCGIESFSLTKDKNHPKLCKNCQNTKEWRTNK